MLDQHAEPERVRRPLQGREPAVGGHLARQRRQQRRRRGAVALGRRVDMRQVPVLDRADLGLAVLDAAREERLPRTARSVSAASQCGRCRGGHARCAGMARGAPALCRPATSAASSAAKKRSILASEKRLGRKAEVGGRAHVVRAVGELDGVPRAGVRQPQRRERRRAARAADVRARREKTVTGEEHSRSTAGAASCLLVRVA